MDIRRPVKIGTFPAEVGQGDLLVWALTDSVFTGTL